MGRFYRYSDASERLLITGFVIIIIWLWIAYGITYGILWLLNFDTDKTTEVMFYAFIGVTCVFGVYQHLKDWLTGKHK